MPRPELYPIKKIIGFDDRMIDRIEAWRRKQSPIPSVSEAMRQLIAMGLASAPSGRSGRNKQADAASRMAGKTIDELVDPEASPEDRAGRKRRLIKGPKEFRGMRDDQKKPKPRR